MVVSNDVLKDNGLTKVERVDGCGFVIETDGGSHVFLTDELLAVLFRASDLDPSEFI